MLPGSSTILSLTLLAALVSPAHSLALPQSPRLPAAISRRAPSPDYPVSVTRASSDSAHSYGFTHAEDQVYTGTIWVNGVAYQVLLDTGSADSWIDPLSIGADAPLGVFHTGVNSSTVYVDGSASNGAIVLADVTFGPFTIKNQAITLAYGAAVGTLAPEFSNGVLGLGGAVASSIYDHLADTPWADNGIPIAYNLFAHQPDLPAYSTWLPSRSEIGFQDGGVLTFGEVLANTTAVLDAPVLESIIRSEWTVIMDGLYVDGRFVSGHSNNSKAYANATGVAVPAGGTLATFDTGTTFVRGPNWYVDQVYGAVPGAVRMVDDGDVMYAVPCDTRMNISFVFSGVEYPIRPADAHRVVVTPDGQLVCLSSIIGGNNFSRDWLIGDTFLRNVYSLWGYGNVSNPENRPYMQMTSIIDPAEAWRSAPATFLARVLAFAEHYHATRTAPVVLDSTALPLYTGPPLAASASLTRVPARPTVLALYNDDDTATASSGVHVLLGVLAGVLVVLVLVAAAAFVQRRARRRADARRSGYRPLVRARPDAEADAEGWLVRQGALALSLDDTERAGARSRETREQGRGDEVVPLCATRYDAESDGPSPASCGDPLAR